MTTPPPGLTRFKLDLRSKDGTPAIHLYCDVDQVVVPTLGSSFGIDVDYGVTVGVRHVYYYPTNDPMVYVSGSMTVEIGAEAEDIAAVALSHGWRRI